MWKGSCKMLINGELQDATTKLPVINPSTGEPFTEVPSASKAQVQLAVAAAREAQPGWAAMPLDDRKKLMLEVYGAVLEQKKELAEMHVREQGQPLWWGEKMIDDGSGFFALYSSFYPVDAETVISETDTEKVVEYRSPVGVVAGICPWNWPFVMAAWKISQSICAGNTIVLKPSPFTPCTALMMGDIFKSKLPPGVVNIISGGNDVGQWLTEHNDVNMIHFTGSTNTGKLISAAASSTLKKLNLELGGNDAAIVLEDADVKATVKGIVDESFRNMGQFCMAPKRIFVHESKFDDVVAEFVRVVEEKKMGDGFAEGMDVGPMTNKMQFDRIIELVEDAKAAGAKIHTGGQAQPGGGYFYPPTIITGVAEGTRIVDEEQFGPALPIMTFSSVEEVVQRANATKFGLGGSVWGTDLDQATAVAAKLEAGTVWVNQHAYLSPTVPFGGVKESGVGYVFKDIRSMQVAKYMYVKK